MKISMELSPQSIQKAINQITEYRDSLPDKCQQLSEELAEVGIKVAREKASASSAFGGYISFEIENDDGELILVADSPTVLVEWEVDSEIRAVEISPLLMAEFGSGFKAKNPLEYPAGGQGALNTYGHAFDKNGWWFKPIGSDTFIHSYGYAPHQPMYSASIAMIEAINEVAKKVFET